MGRETIYVLVFHFPTAHTGSRRVGHDGMRGVDNDSEGGYLCDVMCTHHAHAPAK